jgi:hypothetical protein
MYALAVIMQAQPDGVVGLSRVNTWGFLIFIAFIGLLLLMSAHWYRMKDQVDRKHRVNKRGMFGTDERRISQLQYMSRSELREMVMKERAHAESEVAKKPEPQPRKEDYEKLAPIGSTTAPLTAIEDPLTEPAAETESRTVEPVGPAQHIRPPRLPNEADVLAGILMHGEDRSGEKEATEPKEKKEVKRPHPYSDRIERSISSNESLEEFRRKSRRI